ncbi:MAG: methyltransferase domain-containing protein [Cyanobacteria bacterium P01_G01_bin.67]
MDFENIFNQVLQETNHINYAANNPGYYSGKMYRIQHLWQKDATLIDLGGSYDPGNAVLSHFGMNVTVIDYLEDYTKHKYNLTNNHNLAEDEKIINSYKKETLFKDKYNVNFVKADLLEIDLNQYFKPNSIDVICSQHCLEHLHHSPKKLLQSAIDVLKPNGKIFIEVPNAANIRKRLALLMGHTNYLSYAGFYNSEKYVGHIREYTVGDLEYLAQQLNLQEVKIFGKNYYGSLYNVLPKQLHHASDYLLQKFPGLCGSIFLEGKKATV